MEPMALGSPPSSPASPSINPNFLPSFLMGDTQPSTPNPNISPARNKTPNLKVGFSTPAEARSFRQKLFSQSMSEPHFNQSPYSNIHGDKSGPPKQGLFDTIESKGAVPLNSTMQSSSEQVTFAPNESFSKIGNDTLNYSQAMMNLNESLNRSTANNIQHPMSSGKIDTLWVTVFGFPPSATSLILAQMVNCGCIVEKKFPAQGNWINLKYSSFHEVSKALCLNGKLISSNIMIGVVPYVNKQENKENINAGVTSPIRARSLRHSFVSPPNSNTVIPQNVPQKSTGLVTKAMEYVFGW